MSLWLLYHMWHMKTLHHSTGYSVPLILISILSMLFRDLVMLPAFIFVHFWKNSFSEVWNLCLENLCCMFYTHSVRKQRIRSAQKTQWTDTFNNLFWIAIFSYHCGSNILCFCSIIAGNNALDEAWSITFEQCMCECNTASVDIQVSVLPSGARNCTV